MPDIIPQPPKPLGRGSIEPNTALAQAEDVCLSFFDIQGVGVAVAESQFTLDEEIGIIVDHIRNGSAPESLAASRHLRSIMKDALLLNGRLATVNQKVQQDLGDSTKAIESHTTLRLTSRLHERNQTNYGQEAKPVFGEFRAPRRSDDARALLAADPDDNLPVTLSDSSPATNPN